MTIIVNNSHCSILARGLTLIDGSSANNRYLIYQGTMPTNLTDWVEADDSANLLVTFSNFDITHTSNTPRTISSAPAISVVNAVKTGTAAWYAFVNGSSVTRYWFGDVTTPAGTGSLTIDSLSLTLGSPVTWVNSSVEFTTT